MKQATLNSLIRSLADVAQVARALRLLSIMLNMALKPYRSTINALIAACARDFRSVEAAGLYWCASTLCQYSRILMDFALRMTHGAILFLAVSVVGFCHRAGCRACGIILPRIGLVDKVLQ